MKRPLVVLVLALGVSVLSAGTATAIPEPGAPGWFLWSTGTAQAYTADGTAPAGWGTRSLVMKPGNNQITVSTTLVSVPGVTRPVQLEVLSYHTYVHGFSPDSTAPTLQLAVDVDGDRLWDTHLVFEPAYNGQVAKDLWQKWNARAGLWYSTRPVLGMVPQVTLLTLDQINARSLDQHGAYTTLSLLPADPWFDIRIQYGSSGGDYDGQVGRVDGVEIKAYGLPKTRHDFETALVYLSKLLT